MAITSSTGSTGERPTWPISCRCVGSTTGDITTEGSRSVAIQLVASPSRLQTESPWFPSSRKQQSALSLRRIGTIPARPAREMAVPASTTNTPCRRWRTRARTRGQLAPRLERVQARSRQSRQAGSRDFDGTGIDVGADEVATGTQRRDPGGTAPPKRVAHGEPRFRARLEHELEESHRLLSRVRHPMNARDRPHVGEVATHHLAPTFAREDYLFMAAAEVVAHAEVHLVPDDDALDVEEFAHQCAERERR